MLQGTSMSSPQAAGASALLLSAAKEKGIALPPANLRTALVSTADHIKGVQAYEEGAGSINIVDAWTAIKAGATAHEYTVKAPVDTALDQALKTPGFGTGLYDREGGLKAGVKKSYDITVTRTSGPDKAIRHELYFENNAADTFKIVGSDEVMLELNKPVTVKVAAKSATAGIKSAILEVDDPKTEGIDKQIMTTVVVSAPVKYTFSASGSVQRNSNQSYFLTVPEGARTLEVAISGLAATSQTRFISIHPYGVAVEDTGTPYCYSNFPITNGCAPDVRSYPNPQPGVWEVEVESRRASPLLDNPYKLDAEVLGVTFDPAEKTIAEAKIGTPVAAEWTVTNQFSAIDGSLKSGFLGSSLVGEKTIADGGSQETSVTLPEGVDRFEVAIGGVSDLAADLDLSVFKDGKSVGQSADGDSEEKVSLTAPAAGTYTIVVDGYSVPSGSTSYGYKDVYFAPSLGTVTTDASKAVKLPSGAAAKVSAEILVKGAAPEGRKFFGELQLVNSRGTVAGTSTVTIEKALP